MGCVAFTRLLLVLDSKACALVTLVEFHPIPPNPIQANDQADWVRYIAKLRERDSTLRKAVHTICSSWGVLIASTHRSRM